MERQRQAGNDTTNSISLRGWRRSDFGASVALNREAEEHIGMSSESGNWAKDMSDIDATFIQSGGQFVLGEIGERLVVMGGYLLSDAGAEIKRMRVTPTLQGMGIGYWFLSSLEAGIAAKGIQTITVSTTSAQEGALRLYAGAGYQETGRVTEDRPHDPGLVIVTFNKTLT